MIGLIFFMLGWYRFSFSSVAVVSQPASVQVGRVCSLPVTKSRSVLLKLRISSGVLRNQHVHGPVYVNASFPQNDTLLNARPGDHILFYAAPVLPVNPGNPEAFDYSAYLRYRNVYYQVFVPQGRWHLIVTDKKDIRDIPLLIKRKLLQRIVDTPGDEDAKGVLAAVTLGTRDYLDPELKSAYANAGGIHVMAVSGLHVGMIWMFLGWLTFFLGRGRSSAVLRFLIVTGILWFYAMMTGLSASVTRSCLMFSLVSLGRLINRNSDTFNTVMVAAFLQLWFKPVLLFDAGFEFSYLAVFGIILFHEKITSLVPVHGFLLVKIRDLAGISLSAQLLTFPLGIYYFHQFPVWFLLTNFFIIPVVTVLVLLYLLSVLFFFLPPASFILTHACIWLSGIMNRGVGIIDHFPVSVINGLSLNGLQVCLLLLLPLLILAFIRYRQPSLLLTSLFLFLVFMFTGILRRSFSSEHDTLMVYNTRGLPAVSIISGGNHTIYTNASDTRYNRSIEYAGKTYWMNHYIHEPLYFNLFSVPDTLQQVFSLPGTGNLILSEPCFTVAFISDRKLFSHWKTVHPCPVKFIILTGSDLPPPKALSTFFRADIIIISSSMPAWEVYTEEELAQLPPVYDVRNSGCFLFRAETSGILKK